MGNSRTVQTVERLQWLSGLPSFEFELGDEQRAPTEFRLFRAGWNKTDKGDFLFDEDAAASVMAFYRQKGASLMADYEHQSLQSPPIKAPASASEWVPEIRNGELWATGVKWTEPGRAHIEAKEYRYFSPAFQHDAKTNRVLKVVNFALTNNPAMHQLEPLVAATAADPNQGETTMACEECKALTAKLTAYEEECKSLKAQLSSFVDQKKKEKAEEEEKDEKLTALTALRSSVLALAGKDDDASAIGVLTALKASHARLATLEQEVATERLARLTSEFGVSLDQACKDGKVTPAQRPFWEGQAKDLGTEKGLTMLKAFCETATPRVAATVTTHAEEPAKASPEMRVMAANMGTDINAFMKDRASH
jgi:phage I-like protein